MEASFKLIKSGLEDALKRRIQSEKDVEGGLAAILPHISRFNVGDDIIDREGNLARVIGRTPHIFDQKQKGAFDVFVRYEIRRYKKNGELASRVGKISGLISSREWRVVSENTARKNKKPESGRSRANPATDRKDKIEIRLKRK